jgi:hypothetical protein
MSCDESEVEMCCMLEELDDVYSGFCLGPNFGA